MQQAKIFILNTTEKGAGFGHDMDSGDSVFIPRNVMDAAGAKVLNSYDAQMIPNTFRQDVPWLVINITPNEPKAVAVEAFALPDFITNNTAAQKVLN
jgi:hypothetical protein